MSERDGYRPGVPCWAAAVHPDAEAGVVVYTELFGWEAADIMPPEGPGRYFVCTLGGRDVAAVGSGRGGEAPSVPAWGTYVWVEHADAAAARAAAAGACSWSHSTCSMPAGWPCLPTRRGPCSAPSRRTGTGAPRSSTSREHGP